MGDIPIFSGAVGLRPWVVGPQARAGGEPGAEGIRRSPGGRPPPESPLCYPAQIIRPPGTTPGGLMICGAEGTRTPDPLHAMQVRYQLRHSPERTELYCTSGLVRKSASGLLSTVPRWLGGWSTCWPTYRSPRGSACSSSPSWTSTARRRPRSADCHHRCGCLLWSWFPSSAAWRGSPWVGPSPCTRTQPRPGTGRRPSGRPCRRRPLRRRLPVSAESALQARLDAIDREFDEAVDRRRARRPVWAG